MKIGLYLLALSLLVFCVSCASFNNKLKNLLDGDQSDSTTPSTGKQASNDAKYSDNPEMPPDVKRQYKHVTKQSLEDESGLDQKSGSLWVMEGQGAYLFSQNVMRLVGDPIGVMIDGEPKEQLQAKSDVLKDLIGKIEERQKLKARQLAEENTEDKDKAKDQENKDKTADDGKKTADNAKTPSAKDFNVKLVPTRIVERTIEGNYRVKGSQPFMIGNREFKVIVTGVVRAEDFNEDGISSSKLLDPKFDIVSQKRAGAEM